MSGGRYTWDAAKAERNKRKHGVDFETATEVFLDPARIQWHDRAHSHAEERWRTIGMSGENVLFVVFTERRGDIIRIISARKATPNERRKYGRFHS